MPAMRVEGRCIKFVAESVPVLEDEEGEEEMLGSPVSPVEAVATIAVSPWSEAVDIDVKCAYSHLTCYSGGS